MTEEERLKRLWLIRMMMSSGNPNDAVPGYDVILLAGQSNMVGYTGPVSNPTDQGNSKVLQYAQSGASINTVIQADEPLAHPDTFGVSGGFIGHAVAFAKLYAAATAKERKVLLVPCASGGTGFDDNRWNPGNDLFAAAVTAANAAMTQGSGTNRFVGVLWHQGELDALHGVATGIYAYNLDTAIVAFRAQITGAANSWLILGQMVPEYIAGTGGAPYAAIDVAHQDTPHRILRCAFWTGNSGTGDVLHYAAAMQRLNGASAFAALSNLSSSLVLPGAVTGLTVGTITGTSVDLSWTAPVSGCVIEDYKVEYGLSGSGVWNTFSHTRQVGVSITVSGLSQLIAYDFRVSASSTPGFGTVSSTVTANTTTTANVSFDAVNKGATTVLSNSNKDMTTSTTWMTAWTDTAKASGQWYLEFTCVQYAGSPGMEIGLADATWAIATQTYLGVSSPSIGFGDFGGGIINAAGFTGTGAKITACALNDVFALAVDVPNKKAWIYKNGVILQGDPVAGTSPSITWSGNYTIHAGATSNFSTTKMRINSASLVYTPPSGYSAWT